MYECIDTYYDGYYGTAWLVYSGISVCDGEKAHILFPIYDDAMNININKVDVPSHHQNIASITTLFMVISVHNETNYLQLLM